ncbi:DUF3307 domain-containing protein, partial [Clostridium sp.]|uniref:DUF3307 domain-containing protein n=1 Tax=Clostridium sp. TaxID=1506 RepID=UPI003F401B66
MDLNVFLILILSHIVFDFVFQGSKILKLRFPEILEEAKSNTIKGNLFHSLIHFVGVYIITLLFSLVRGQAISISFLVVLIISIFHFIIDETKSILYIKNTSAITNIWVFLFDQLSHLLVIVGFLKVDAKIDVMNIFRERLVNNNFLASEKALLTLIFIFIATWVTGIFIKILLGYLSEKSNLKLNNYLESNQDSKDDNDVEVSSSEKSGLSNSKIDSNEEVENEEESLEEEKNISSEVKINRAQNHRGNEATSVNGVIENNSKDEENTEKEELDEGAPNGGFIIGILE